MLRRNVTVSGLTRIAPVVI